MALRLKLLLFALVTAVFPIAGWQLLVQMEDTLRTAQEESLLAAGRVIAQAAFALEPGWAAQAEASGRWYARSIDGDFAIDGYADDWRALAMPQQRRGDARLGLDFQAAISNRWLYLWLEIRDATPVFPAEPDPLPERHDHLVLVHDDQAHRIYCFRDGPLSSVSIPTRQQPQPAPPIAGYCRRRPGGYVIELALPRVNLLPRLSLRVVDFPVAGADLPRASVGSLDADGRLSAWPVVSVGARNSRLDGLVPPDARIRLLSPDGWVLAQSGRLNLERPSDQPLTARRWLRAVVYRGLFAPPLADGNPYRLDHLVPDVAEAHAALAGQEATGWRGGTSSLAVVLTAGVPLAGGSGRGALLLEREADALLLWTNRTIGGLLFSGLVAMLLAGAVLFGYTSYLSYRIRRLRNAAESVLTPEGRLAGDFPRSKASDEVGDLSRSFARLLAQIGEYHDYLRSLNRKLSHELSTPLAIVRSSLENLEHESLPDSARTYAARALAGVERLRKLLRAMSEAGRIEQAVAAVEAESFDLATLVRVAAAGLADLAPRQRVEVDVPDSAVSFRGSPELIQQALDKLFDNALGFTPEHGRIDIRLRMLAEGAAELSVRNDGPPLPRAMQGKLFQSMVSLRSDDHRGAHLGLGLYIVRLVAEAHRGEVHAEDDPAGGVCFRLLLRGMPAR